MNLMQKHLFFVIFFLVNLIIIKDSYAQNQDEGNLFILKGKVLNQENEEPLPFVTIFNATLKRGVTSDSSGYFSIKVQLGDSLIFQSLGYDNLNWKADEEALAGTLTTFRMLQKTYELQSVDVTAFRTEEDLKKHILSMDMPEEQKVEIQGLDMIKNENHGDGTYKISGPVSFLYDKFSRRANEQRKFMATKSGYEKQQMITLKFKEAVKKIINAEDPDELEEFMGFCKLQDSFIENANEYDLIVAVNQCYDEFKLTKNKN